jgi:hypothetical protein
MIWRPHVMARRTGVAFLPLGLVVLVVACVSPTLPLPPPATPEITAGVDSAHVSLSSPCGGVENGADVEVINTNPTVPAGEVGVVALASDCGAWSAQVYAHVGDVLNIVQQFENTTSAPITVQVPPGD